LSESSSEISKFLDQVYPVDILNLLERLPSKSIDCIYADPDYNVGIKYNKKSHVKDFSDYLKWCEDWSKECYRVLKTNGNFFIINYPKNNSHLRVNYLDDNFYNVTDYAWVYNTNIGHSKHRFTTAHRSILHCIKSENNKFYKKSVAVEYKNPGDKRIMRLLSDGEKGRMPYSWFYFNLVKNVSRSKTFHSCQIPEELSEMLIRSCTKQNDVVLVLFGGSGSEIAVCKRLNRRYIAAEIDSKYFDLIQKRISNGGDVPDKYRLMK
jgi:DNA modification methylase